MNHYKLQLDYNYKYCSSLNTGGNEGNRVIAKITLWKTNNRLSYLRCLQFLDKFFSDVFVDNIKVKTRTSKIRNYSRFQFDFHKNWSVFSLLRYKLPEPEITLQESQYIITYNFYRFVIEIPVAITDHYTLSKITQIFGLNINKNHVE